MIFVLILIKLFSSDTVFKDDYVEEILKNDILYDNSINVLDDNFCEDEIIKAITRLKRQKSPGDDLLIADMFIDSKEQLAPMLCKLFNYIYNSDVYPQSWTKGILVLVPKKGNLRYVDNYRGDYVDKCIFKNIFTVT